MNRKSLNQLFDAYIQHFETLNDSTNDESYKWGAIVEIGRASCRERVCQLVTGVQTCALPI